MGLEVAGRIFLYRIEAQEFAGPLLRNYSNWSLCIFLSQSFLLVIFNISQAYLVEQGLWHLKLACKEKVLLDSHPLYLSFLECSSS